LPLSLTSLSFTLSLSLAAGAPFSGPPSPATSFRHQIHPPWFNKQISHLSKNSTRFHYSHTLSQTWIFSYFFSSFSSSLRTTQMPSMLQFLGTHCHFSLSKASSLPTLPTSSPVGPTAPPPISADGAPSRVVPQEASLPELLRSMSLGSAAACCRPPSATCLSSACCPSSGTCSPARFLLL